MITTLRGQARRRALAVLALVTLAGRAAGQPYAYVANLGSDDVSVVDAVTESVVATLPAGDDPDGVAVSPDGTRAYVAGFLSDSLTVVDTALNTVLATIPVGAGPVGVAVSPDGGRVYVANRGADSLAVVDPIAATVVATIAVGRGPNAVAVTPDGATAFVTNSFTRDPGVVSVVDLATNSVRATIAVQHVPNRVAITPDGSIAYVTTFRSWNVSAIDTHTNQVLTTLRVGYKPSGIAVNPNGAYAYVTVQRGIGELPGTLNVIDVATQRVRESVDAGFAPSAIGILRNGGTGYVSNFWAGTLTVVDLGDETLTGEISVGERPFAVAVNCVGDGCAETPYTPKPTKTVTETPTETATPTQTLTPSRTPTRTATATLRPGLSHVTIELAPYPTTDPPFLDVSLSSGGQTVLGFSHDILFAGGVRVAAGNPGEPDCQVFESPPLRSARFEFIPAGCEFACDGLHVELDAAEPFFDLDLPAVPYFCRLEIPDFLEPGTYRLRVTNVAASGPNGEVLAARGRDGIVTILPPSSPSPVLSPYPTRTPPPPRTPTPTPPPVAFLRVGSASGQPGQRVSVDVRLDTRGHAIAGVQNDLAFDLATAIAALPNGRPDCSVNPAINKAATTFTFHPPFCSGAECHAVRGLVLALDNVDPIADGAVLYICRIDIAADAAPGSHLLQGVELGSSDPDGAFLPTGSVDGAITVLPRGALANVAGIAAVPATTRCAGGANDGTRCAADADCPAGACVAVQSVCDGGEDDGLLCDCPGGTCGREPACMDDARGGTCRGGTHDGACCDRAFNCRGAACVETHHLCATGASKGMPCLRDAQCIAAACIASARRCVAGDFDRAACIDAGDCPRGACVDPQAPPTVTPTLPPGAAAASRGDGGCAVGSATAHGSAAFMLAPLLAALIMRRLRRGPNRTED